MNKWEPDKLRYWADDEVYNKAKFQLRAAILSDLNKIYNMYDYAGGRVNDQVANAMVQHAEDFALRIRGADKPIMSRLRERL